MVSGKIYSSLVCIVIWSLILTAGCAPVGEKITKIAKPEVELEKQIPKAVTPETVTLALKYTPQDLTTYRVITEARRSVEWEGSLPEDIASKPGHNDRRVEVTFVQQIQSVDDKGNAVAKITIEGLKCSSIVNNNPVLDFDTSRQEDRNRPLAKLVGQSYTIKIAPAGQVSLVSGAEQAQAAVKGSLSVRRVASALLSPNAIKERHGSLTLPQIGEKQLSPGDSWSSIKTFSFDMMGSNSYERIYTLKEIRDGGRLAFVEMNSIPSSVATEQMRKEQTTSSFLKMFDNTETYTGQLRFDLTTGKVEKYLEQLQSEWIAAFPPAKQEANEGPVVLRMSDTRHYRLEKIDNKP